MTMRAMAAMLGLAVSACAVGPDFKSPQPTAADRYLADSPGRSEAPATLPTRFQRGTEVVARWWTLFGSAPLDTLVADAVARSPNLKAARAALRQSEDSLKAGYGVFYPQIGAAASATRQSSVVVIDRALASTGAYSVGTVAASVSYGPDLFGGQRRTVEALGAKVDLARDEYLAAYLALTANVVNAAIARAGYQAQRDALVDVIQMQDDQVRIAEVQFQAGTASYAPVVALQSQRAANQATRIGLEQRIDQSEDLLALLGARAPSEASLPSIAIEDLSLPVDLPDTLPSLLVRRRPDILAAEADLHAASAQIGIATADLFPSLALGGERGTSNSAISAMFHAGIPIWSVQASVAASLFNGGSQWYTRRAAIDAYDGSLALYEQTVLAALSQVADTMRALAHDAQAMQADGDALAAAQENLHLTRINYEAGTAGYLDLLTADGQFQQARLALFGAVAQRLQDTVALYAALGGGWWDDPAARPFASTAPR